MLLKLYVKTEVHSIIEELIQLTFVPEFHSNLEPCNLNLFNTEPKQCLKFSRFFLDQVFFSFFFIIS